jgi:hypothetical protein
MDREVVRSAFRYLLELEIDGSDRENLVDSLEDETFPIRELLGEAEMVRQIREGELRFEHGPGPRQAWFAGCIEVLSVHLSEYVIGLELEEGWNAQELRTKVAVTKHAGCRGEVIAVPLAHRIAYPSGEIEPGLEDLGWLRAHFLALPRWAQDAYRIKFPELRLL